jgi:hypothetical protein
MLLEIHTGLVVLEVATTDSNLQQQRATRGENEQDDCRWSFT